MERESLLAGNEMARSACARAFEEWDRRYRENPQAFLTDVEHLLGHTPQLYGDACAAYFLALIAELGGA